MKSFGQLLREVRRANEMSLGDIAEIANVSVSYVSAIERDLRSPFSKPELVKVLNKLHAMDRLAEFEAAAIRARLVTKRLEIEIDQKPDEVVQFLTTLARAVENNELDERKVRLIMKHLGGSR